MINFRSVNFYLVLLTFVSIAVGLLGIFNLSLLAVIAYLFLFWGVYLFYSSYLREYKTGITFGSVLFLSGSLLIVISKYEILNFGSIVIPTLLVIIGLSLITSNILTKPNSTVLVFSILSLVAGVWLIIARGSTNLDLYLSTVYMLAKSYWIIILISIGIMFLAAKSFKKKNVDQY